MQNDIHELLDSANQIILGKQNKIRLALCCLLARGHLLIEDIPGVGKTTLAHTLAKLLGLNYQRIQFTSDILPADMIGASIFDAKNHDFKFHPGTVFNQLVLADEINRATRKALSWKRWKNIMLRLKEKPIHCQPLFLLLPHKTRPIK